MKSLYEAKEEYKLAKEVFIKAGEVFNKAVYDIQSICLHPHFNDSHGSYKDEYDRIEEYWVKYRCVFCEKELYSTYGHDFRDKRPTAKELLDK